MWSVRSNQWALTELIKRFNCFCRGGVGWGWVITFQYFRLKCLCLTLNSSITEELLKHSRRHTKKLRSFHCFLCRKYLLMKFSCIRVYVHKAKTKTVKNNFMFFPQICSEHNATCLTNKISLIRWWHYRHYNLFQRVQAQVYMSN